MNARQVTALSTFALTVACTTPQTRTAADDARDIEALNALLAEHVAAVNAGDVAANLAGFTEDVVYLPPDGPPVVGKPALAALVGAFAEGFTAEIAMEAEETIVMGDWAFQWGPLSGTVRPLTGGEGMPMNGKWAYLYRRQPDGTWKIARDIYNTPTEAANE